MIFAVLFEDDETHADKRPLHMRDHLAFLADHASEISAAGPLQHAQTGCPAGGLWLVEADSAERVRSLIHEDPFWPTGLRKSIDILQWNRVFAHGDVLLQE